MDGYRSKGISASLDELRPTTYVYTDLLKPTSMSAAPSKWETTGRSYPWLILFNLFNRKNPEGE
jgi:hypothetical protein